MLEINKLQKKYGKFRAELFDEGGKRVYYGARR